MLKIIVLTLGIVVTPQLWATPKPINIHVLYWSMNIPGQVAMRQGLETQAKKINEQAQKEGRGALVITPYVASGRNPPYYSPGLLGIAPGLPTPCPVEAPAPMCPPQISSECERNAVL